MEQKPLPVSVTRLTREIHTLAGNLYDKVELLDKVAARIGKSALYDIATLQAASETLQDAVMVLGERFGLPDTARETACDTEVGESAPVDREIPLTVARETVVGTTEEKSFPIESDEAFDVIRRYFATHPGDPQAWTQLGDHLRRNNIITPPTDHQLADFVVERFTEFEEEIEDFHGLKGCWTQFDGSTWVFVASAANKQPPVVSASRPQPVISETPTAQPAPVETVPVLAARLDYLPALLQEIQTLPPKGNYARFNALLKYLQTKQRLSADQASTELLELIADEKLFSFHTKGGRHVTPDQALAEQLHTPHVKQSHRARQSQSKPGFANYEAAATVMSVLFTDRPRIEQAMTCKDLARESSYPVETVKAAVAYLKDLGCVALDHDTRNKNNRRMATQKVLRVRPIIRDAKNNFKNKSPLEIARLLEQTTTSPSR